MTLSNAEKSQVKQLLQQPQWQVIERIANELCLQLRDGSVITPTQWETLQAVLTREGEVRGIRKLIQELYKIAQE